MSGIDPLAVREFVTRIGGAQQHADSIVGSLDAVVSGSVATSDELEGALFSSQSHLGMLRGQLGEARSFAAPRDAFDAARAVGEDRAGELSKALDALADAVHATGGAGASPDLPAVVRRATDARDIANRIASWHLADIADRATDPVAGDVRMGAATAAGVWEPLDRGVLAELHHAAARVQDEQRDLADDISELGRPEGGGSSALLEPQRRDEDIAAHDLARELDAPDALERLLGSATSARAELQSAGDVASRTSTPPGVTSVPARLTAAEAPDAVVATGVERLLTRDPAAGTPLAIVQHGSARRGDLPYRATGAVTAAPTREAAMEIAQARRTGHSMVMPHIDGTYRVVDAEPHPTALAAVRNLVRLGDDASGIEQQLGRVDAFVADGVARRVAGPTSAAQYDEIIATRGDEPFGRTAVRLRDLAGVPQHADELPRPRASGQQHSVSAYGTMRRIAAAPDAGATVLHVQRSSRAGDTAAPMLATGRSAVVPSRASAIALAAAHADSSWAVLPDIEAGWHVVEVRPGDGAATGTARIASIRHEAGRVDAFVERGSVRESVVPTVDVDAEVARAYAQLEAPPVPTSASSAVQLGFVDGGPLLTAHVPGGKLRRPRDTELIAHPFQLATVVTGSRTQALDQLARLTAANRDGSPFALARLDEHSFAVLPLQSPGRSRDLTRLRTGLTRDSIASVGDPRVEAVAFPGKDAPTVVDLAAERS